MLADCVISYVFAKKTDAGSVADLETQGEWLFRFCFRILILVACELFDAW
jgi:hypothetical protein